MNRRSALLVLVLAAPPLSTGCGRQLTGTSLALGSDGLALVGYGLLAFDTNATPAWSQEQLKIARCSDPECTTAALTIVDPDGGSELSLAFGPDGLALMSYTGGGDNALWVAHCEDTACTRVRTRALSDAPQFPVSTSIAFGGDARGLISYRTRGGGDLMVAHCDDDACTQATITILERGSGAQHRTSAMAIGSDGLGLIAYPESTSGRMRVAHCDNAQCTAASLRTIDDATGGDDPAVAIGRDGLALIAYTTRSTGALKVARCIDVSCTRADLATIDPGGPTLFAGFTSMTVGSDGLPLISYSARIYSELRVAHCADLACTRADATTSLERAASGRTIRETSVATGRDGRALISYESGATLRVAHCADVQCTQATMTTHDSVPTARP